MIMVVIAFPLAGSLLAFVRGNHSTYTMTIPVQMRFTPCALFFMSYASLHLDLRRRFPTYEKASSDVALLTKQLTEFVEFLNEILK